jgi:hypothetical protein
VCSLNLGIENWNAGYASLIENEIKEPRRETFPIFIG